MALLRSKQHARILTFVWAPALALILAGCGGEEPTGNPPASTTTTTTTGGGAGGGGQGGAGQGGGGQGGQGGGAALTLDGILQELRDNRDAALLKYAADPGWPIHLPEGYLFVSADPALNLVAGDHDGWAGSALTAEPGEDFQWALLGTPQPGDKYKFTNLTAWAADPWARSYTVDGNGEISHIEPSVAHIDRYHQVGDAAMAPRPLRVWVPAEPIDRVLYAHDGQNLFYDGGLFGSWQLEQSAPPGMLIVGIDNTEARMDEYTHVQDDIDGTGQLIGGQGDAYADFLEMTVRPIIQARYGEPGLLGVMGSSLGGLISLHIADRYEGTYAFAASLSGTLGWGSLDPNIHNETMIERYAAAGHRDTVLYLDSGGGGMTCADSDGDGINDDDLEADDNYCETVQMRDVLFGLGYVSEVDLYHWWEPNALHNEAAWAARVDIPLGIFSGL